MNALPAILALLFFSLAAPALAADGEKEPEFLKHFFAPELVLQHASAIGLERTQRTEILKDIARVTGSTTESQLSMLEHFGAIEEQSAAEAVDEKVLLASIREVLTAEMRVKEAHMGLLIRIRNLLTPAQRELLRKIRDGNG
jgi:Spy/CpxP family protein refolding chaperone